MPAEKHLRKATALLALAALLNSAPAAAQSDENRVIKGQVLSAEGQAVAKALVHLKKESTGEILTVVTDKEGRYRFNDLSTKKDYTLHAEFEGAKSNERKVSQFDTRTEIFINLRLKPPAEDKKEEQEKSEEDETPEKD